MMDVQKEWPLVTVATLCYNTGKYVIEALECVVRQEYPNIQHIIVEDCSTDNSALLVADWIEKHKYPCQYIRHSENQGVHNTLKEIFELSQGKYWTTISDDLWPDYKLHNQVTIFESLDDSYAMVYGDTQMIDSEGKILESSMFAHYRGEVFVPPTGVIFVEVAKGFYFFIQSAVIRLSHFKEMDSQFDPEIISEDWDWQLWLSRHYKVMGLAGVYASYRILNTSITRNNWTPEKLHRVWQSHTKMFLKYYDEDLNTSFEKNMIFEKLWGYYVELNRLKNFTLKHEIKYVFFVLSKINPYDKIVFLYRIIKHKAGNFFKKFAS
jgi:glycosyltransferase involved in cell wall biosynthesis